MCDGGAASEADDEAPLPAVSSEEARDDDEAAYLQQLHSRELGPLCGGQGRELPVRVQQQRQLLSCRLLGGPRGPQARELSVWVQQQRKLLC